MKVGILGSTSIEKCDLKKYLPEKVSMIVTGIDKKIHNIAIQYADENKISKTTLQKLPQIKSKEAEQMRDMAIIGNSDRLLVFWDGKSKNTEMVVDLLKDCPKNSMIVVCEKN